MTALSPSPINQGLSPPPRVVTTSLTLFPADGREREKAPQLSAASRPSARQAPGELGPTKDDGWAEPGERRRGAGDPGPIMARQGERSGRGGKGAASLKGVRGGRVRPAVPVPPPGFSFVGAESKAHGGVGWRRKSRNLGPLARFVPAAGEKPVCQILRLSRPPGSLGD